MEFHFDRRIRFSRESAHKSLYSWSLQEISETGEQIGSDQVPWPWTLAFFATELRYVNTVRIERQLDSSENTSAVSDASMAESIFATLRSGNVRGDGTIDSKVRFSMFGTDRDVRDFRLAITPLVGDEERENCSVWGCVSYTSEVDFRTSRSDDIVQISIDVSPKRFRALANLIEKTTPECFAMQIGMVSGFYSEWSPSITTNRVKILTSGEEHKVEVEGGSLAQIRKLGEVGDFRLSAVLRNPLPERHFSKSASEEITNVNGRNSQIEASEQRQDLVTEYLAKNFMALEKLKWPIWIMVIVLLFLYFK